MTSFFFMWWYQDVVQVCDYDDTIKYDMNLSVSVFEQS